MECKTCQEYNAIIYYQDPQVDPITCRFVEPEASTRLLELRIAIEDYEEVKQNLNTGLRFDNFIADGRCVFPLHMPLSIKPGREYSIKFKDNLVHLSEGKCYIKPSINSVWGLESVFGDYISLQIEVDR